MSGFSFNVIFLRTVTAILIAVLTAISGMRESPKSDVRAQERLRVVIDEVQLSVAAYDQYGHLDPTLEAEDLLVLENGRPQEVRSVRRVPAAVVLLLDTGAETNQAKSIENTRLVAKNIVSALDLNDQLSVMQFSDRVELLQDWTRDSKQVVEKLNTKLLSGKRARLSDALVAATERFAELPIGSRHLVLISDGVETVRGKFDRSEALKRLATASVVVHVISYTTVSREALKRGREIFRDRNKTTTPQDVVNSLPDEGGSEPLKRFHKPGGKTIDLDPERQRRVRQYEEAMSGAEAQLSFLARETGGHFWLPESFEEMITCGSKAARVIDAQYLVTYKPTRVLTSSTAREVRHVHVVSRRVGLTVVSRRYYIAGFKGQFNPN